MSLRWLPIGSIVWVLLASALPQAARSAGDDPKPAEAEAAQTLQFRRVYVPADRPKDWPRGNVKYLPIESAEFEHLLEIAGSTTSSDRVAAAARVLTAQYKARLNGDQLAAGEATLQVIHSAKAPVLLPLDPCGLAIDQASWATTEATGNEPAKATLGLGVSGKLVVLVKESGQLDFNWSLAGRRDTADAVNFRLELPRCPANRLILDLPVNVTPVADHGIVLDANRVDAEFSRWRIELGGHYRVGLRLVPAGAADRRPQLPLVRESAEYQFSLRGVDVSTELKFEAPKGSLRELTLALDPELQLKTAQYGDVAVPWSVASGDGNTATRVVLSFPEPIEETEGVLRLGALAPLQTDRRWRLPRIRVENVSWQEGRATLFVPAPLSIEWREPIDCRQTDMGPLSAPRVGESAQFQYFHPDATVEIVLSSRNAQVQLASGTAITLGSRDMTAGVNVAFDTVGAPQFSLEADVARQWLIDSVETFPSDAMDDWTLERRGGGKRKLTIRLAKALSPARPIRLAINARRLLSPLGRPLGMNDLVPLRFSAPDDGKRLVAIDAVGPYQLELTGSERFNRVDPRSLDAAEKELFAELPRNLLFENDANAADLQVNLKRETPGYTGTLQVEASIAGETLQESYVVTCVPRSARVDRVLVHFCRRRDVPLRWTLGAEDQQQLSARQLSIDEQAAAGLAPEGETWELTLRRPRSQSFEIRGTREVTLSGELPIGLASLPEATSQRATLVIRSFGPATARITNNRLKPIPAEVLPPDRYQTVRAAYRYDPLGDCLVASEPAVTVSTSQDAATPSATVWNCELQSRYEANGKGQHLVTYRLENSGAGQMRLQLPPEAELQDVRGVWVDGSRVVWHRLADRLAIDLPSGKKYPTVSVDFTTPGTQLGIVGSLHPPLPTADLPVLSQHWTVWLPPAYDALDTAVGWRPCRAAPLGWSRRLFGPVGRAPDREPFDPLAAGYWSAVASEPSARRLAERKAQQLLKVLGSLAAGSGAGPGAVRLDWAGLLTDPSVDALQLTLLVDRHAMARIGVTPQTPVQFGSDDLPTARGVSLLQQANLSLLVHSDALLLTSQADAALCHDYLTPLRRHTLWWVLPGPLAEQLRQVAAGMPEATLVPVEAWQRQPAQPRVLWSGADQAGWGPADTSGWTACRLECVGQQTLGEPPVRLEFVHRPTMRLLGSATFLLMIALGWWKLSEKPVLLVSLVGIFGFAALVLPGAYVPIASGAVLAALFCLVFRLIRRRPAATPSPAGLDRKVDPPSTVTVATQLGMVLFVTAAMSAQCVVARGQEPAGESPPTALAVHRVFIPMDANKQPVGGKCYVPQELYNRLYRRAAAATVTPHGWLITGATYRGVLSKESTSERLVVEELKASFDLQVFGVVARIRIPFLREEANLLPNGASLDGQVIQPQWEPDGGVLVFEVPEPGQYRLELSVRPTVRSGGLPGGFDLTIPRLANSRLELSLPPGAPTVEVPSAIGSIRHENEPPRLVAELGPTDRLTVRWPDGTRPGGTSPTVDVEELLWLKVLPGSVVVDARFKFKIAAGQVRQLQLATDPRLRLLERAGDDPPAAEVRSVPGQAQIITFKWPGPVTDGAVVDATFMLTGTSGVGNLRLPELKVLDARSSRRWLAVSVDPALKYEKQLSDQIQAVAVPDFLTGWGAAEEQPLFALGLDPGQTGWAMSVWPGQPETTVEQTLALSFDRDRTELHFDAELLTTAGYNFQYRLTAPAALQLKHVSVLEEGVERVTRWSQGEKGEITVFLSGPVDGQQKLSLRGRLPASDQRRNMPLPTLQIEGTTLGSSEFQLFRRPSVMVKIGRANGLLDVPDSLADPREEELGRLVGWFRAEGQTPIRAALTVEPNRPKVKADQLIRLRSDGLPSVGHGDAPPNGPWSAEVDFQIHVSGGVVDQFRIDAPEPFDVQKAVVSPPAVLKVDRESRQLIVRPPTAIDAAYRFSISSRLALEPGERPSVPQIELKQVSQLKRLLCLPRQAHGQAIDWETRNLKETKLPDGFAAPTQPGSFVTYEVLGAACQAILKPPEQTRAAPRVHLADVRVAWKADGTFSGVATFDLEPGSSTECPLLLPVGYRLVQVTVAGVPSSPLSIRPNRWRISLGPPRLPQRIEVVFTGILSEPAGAARQRFEAPTLGKLSVRKTLWTVVGPSLFEPGKSKVPGSISPADQELIRLKNAAARIESASMLSAEDPEETFRWYWRWAHRLAAARTALRRQPARAGLSGRARTEIRAIDQQQSQIAARLAMTNVLAQFSAGPSVADDPVELWQWSLDRGQAATRCAFSEGVSSIALDYRRAEAGRLQGGLAAATVLAVLIVLLVLGLRRGVLAELYKRWPCALGVVIGLAWWLWLSPSILGWAVVLLSVISALVSGWKHTAPAPGSTIISVRTVR